MGTIWYSARTTRLISSQIPMYLGARTAPLAVFQRFRRPLVEVRAKRLVHLVESSIRKDENPHASQIGKIEQGVLVSVLRIESAPLKPLDPEQFFQRALAILHASVHDELLTLSQAVQDRQRVVSNLSLKLPKNALHLGEQIEVLLAQAILWRACFRGPQAASISCSSRRRTLSEGGWLK